MFTGVSIASSTIDNIKVAYSVAVHTQPIAIGDEYCPKGGILLETGFDENNNNILDPEEIETTEKICNGKGKVAEDIIGGGKDETCNKIIY